jgi:hypothetical protein
VPPPCWGGRHIWDRKPRRMICPRTILALGFSQLVCWGTTYYGSLRPAVIGETSCPEGRK